MSKTSFEFELRQNEGGNEDCDYKCPNNSNLALHPAASQVNMKKNKSYACTQVLLPNGKRQLSEDGDNSKFESNSSWTDQEELKLILAHKEHKNRWSDVAEALKGRTNNNIKNRFYSIFRKIKAKIQKEDYTYLSLIELLEMRYMTNMIQQYLSKPNPNARLKGKRGKDFIYSLIHNLDGNMVKEYNSKLFDLTMKEGTLDELFEKLSSSFQAQKPVLDEEARKTNNEQIMQVPQISMDYMNPTQKNDDFLCYKSNFPEKEEIHSPLFGYTPSSPSFLFSPTALSAGPAAAAANFTACINNKQLCLREGFADYSNELRVESHDLPSTFLTIRCHPQFL